VAKIGIGADYGTLRRMSDGVLELDGRRWGGGLAGERYVTVGKKDSRAEDATVFGW